MNEQRIEELKNALREVVQMVTSRSQPISQELSSLLNQVMDHVASRIEQLRQEESPADQLTSIPNEPPLDQRYPSSNINSFGYDRENQRLLVKFQGDYPKENGPIYGYDNVPEVIFDLFRRGSIPARTDGKNKWGKWWRGKVPSLGASLYTLIKNGGYQYQRLT